MVVPLIYPEFHSRIYWTQQDDFSASLEDTVSLPRKKGIKGKPRYSEEGFLETPQTRRLYRAAERNTEDKSCWYYVLRLFRCFKSCPRLKWDFILG